MKKKDVFLNVITYLFSSIEIIILIAITTYIFSNGVKLLSWDLFTSDYYDTIYTTYIGKDENVKIGGYINPLIEDTYFSENYGICLKDDIDINNNNVVTIAYVDQLSPFNRMKSSSDDYYIQITVNQSIDKIILTNENNDYIIALAKDRAEKIVEKLDQGTTILDMTTSNKGGGIKGSIIATIYLIIITLIIALPIGIFASIYLSEYSKKSRFSNILMSMIDLTSGIPSIVFGLVGVIIFIPFINNITSSNGGSILSGSLTLSIMLLPIIIRNTIDATKTVPDSFRYASLALGASKTQTIFKVIIPNAISGILTSVILSIGKIIGESAALIYAIGTVIKDNIVLDDKATSLAVHIWVLMSGDKPNFEVSCAVSIIILIIIFIMSLSIKLIGKRLNRFNESVR